MAEKITYGQLLHLTQNAAVESHATGVAGVNRLGVKAPDLEELIGEVVDTPTEHTLLARLKAIADALGATNQKDFATETTLAAILAKLIAAPATEAKQDTGNATLASILAKLADPATQTTLAAVLAQLQSGVTPVTLNGSFAEVLARGGSESPANASRSGALAASATETVLETTKPVVITRLDFATNYTDAAGLVGVIIEKRTRAGTYNQIMFPSVTGGSIYGRFTPEIPSSIFDVIVAETGKRVMTLSPGFDLKCPYGVRIKVTNGAAASVNVACVVDYIERELL